MDRAAVSLGGVMGGLIRPAGAGSARRFAGLARWGAWLARRAAAERRPFRPGRRLLDRLDDRRFDPLPVRTGDRLGDRLGDRPGDRLVHRLAARPWSRRSSRAGPVELPVVLELIAAMLAAGQPPDAAAALVGQALLGPSTRPADAALDRRPDSGAAELGATLVGIAAALRLGAPAGQAWAPLQALTPGCPAARTVARATESGTRLAGALLRLAEDARSARVAGAERAVRRVAVLTVLPLGLCFLPAFVAVGVVPLLIGILADSLRL